MRVYMMRSLLTVALHDFLDETWKNVCGNSTITNNGTGVLLPAHTTLLLHVLEIDFANLIVGCDHVRYAIAIVSHWAEATTRTDHRLIDIVQNLHPRPGIRLESQSLLHTNRGGDRNRRRSQCSSHRPVLREQRTPSVWRWGI